MSPDSPTYNQRTVAGTVITTVLVLATLFAAAFALGNAFEDGAAQADELASVPATSPAAESDAPTVEEVKTLNEAILQNELDRQAWNEAAWIHTTNVDTWVTKTNERLAAEEAARQRQAAARQSAQSSSSSSSSSRAPAPSGGNVSARPGICGGDLPPCYVVDRESGFDPTAQNPSSSASGLYQFIDSTWRSCPYSGGYAKASHAPVSVQAQCARWLYAGGAGAGHWVTH